MTQPDPSGKRPYRMRARAKAAEATREKILGAAEAVFDEGPIDSFTLAAVAERSGVTAQTILRHFGNRDGLLIAMLVHAGVGMGRDRDTADAGNASEAIDVLVDHYDKFGDRLLRLLGAEEQNPEIRTMTDFGRAYHREWCEQIFAAGLEGLRGAKRERRIAQLVTVTDIYAWKLLRLDRGLSPRQTKLAMRELLEPLMERASPPGSRHRSR